MQTQNKTRTAPADFARFTRRHVLQCLFACVSLTAATSHCEFAVAEISGPAITLKALVNPDRVTQVACQVSIHGTMISPSESGTGVTNLKLSSTVKFGFDQRQFPSQVAGPFSIRAVRSYSDAVSNTVVGPDYKTSIQLPAGQKLLHVYGTDALLLYLNPNVRLTRQQIDLLQMPCDPLVVAGLLPPRALDDRSERWNTDPWVVPMLAGLDAAVSQSATCSITELTDERATIRFEAKTQGAVSGSATSVELTGEFAFDRRLQLITDLRARLTEKRSPGAVSPGLDVVAEVTWTQKIVTDSAVLPKELMEPLPDEGQQLLTLVTPWRLMLLHSRDWHLFHQTTELVMLRMLNNGSLAGQCNIAPSVTMPVGEFTPDHRFREEVQAALVSRQGVLGESRLTPEQNGWRIHKVSATSITQNKTILWDYYLCTRKSGEQYSLIMSYGKDDAGLVQPAADKIIQSLTIAQPRSVIPLPR